MILLDTNVISEFYRPEPNAMVAAWADAQARGTLYLCTPVLAELRFGVERLAAGRRRDRLRDTIDRIENRLYRGRIIVFDAAAASEYGRVAANRQKAGRRIGQMDAMIAAIALIHGASLATRNTNDFDNLGLELVNPFDPAIA
jgi:toxin FitB